MNASSAKALEALARLLERGAADPRISLQAAYQFGKFDGLLEGSIGSQPVVEAEKAAA